MAALRSGVPANRAVFGKPRVDSFFGGIFDVLRGVEIRFAGAETYNVNSLRFSTLLLLNLSRALRMV